MSKVWILSSSGAWSGLMNFDPKNEFRSQKSILIQKMEFDSKMDLDQSMDFDPKKMIWSKTEC